MNPLARFPRPIRYLLVAVGVVLLLFVLAVVALTVSGRSNTCNSLFSDQYFPVKEAVIDSTPYFLYLQITGWHDKATIFSVYDHKPSFDCSGVAERSSMGSIVDNEDGSFPAPPLQIPLMNSNKVLELRFPKDKDANAVVSQILSAAYDRKPIPEVDIEMTIREAEPEPEALD